MHQKHVKKWHGRVTWGFWKNLVIFRSLNSSSSSGRVEVLPKGNFFKFPVGQKTYIALSNPAAPLCAFGRERREYWGALTELSAKNFFIFGKQETPGLGLPMPTTPSVALGWSVELPLAGLKIRMHVYVLYVSLYLYVCTYKDVCVFVYTHVFMQSPRLLASCYIDLQTDLR